MKILFMCVANSARSQLAEGLAKQLFPTAEIRSAGSQPGKLNPFAVVAMREIGIDISSHYAKAVENLPHEFLLTLDYVITLCAEEVCPTVIAPGALRLHWPFPDPANREILPESEMEMRFRAARDAIGARLREFKAGIEK